MKTIVSCPLHAVQTCSPWQCYADDKGVYMFTVIVISFASWVMNQTIGLIEILTTWRCLMKGQVMIKVTIYVRTSQPDHSLFSQSLSQLHQIATQNRCSILLNVGVLLWKNNVCQIKHKLPENSFVVTQIVCKISHNMVLTKGDS